MKEIIITLIPAVCTIIGAIANREFRDFVIRHKVFSSFVVIITCAVFFYVPKVSNQPKVSPTTSSTEQGPTEQEPTKQEPTEQEPTEQEPDEQEPAKPIVPTEYSKSDFSINREGILQEYKGLDDTVIIPDGVKAIGENAFRDCEIIKCVIIPDSVVSIGDEAFRGCSNLKAAFIPDSVLTLGNSVFYSVHSDFVIYGKPGSAVAGYGNSFIGYDMPEFSQNDDYKIIKGVLLQYKGTSNNIIIPSGVVTISNNVFNGRIDIKNVTIPRACLKTPNP